MVAYFKSELMKIIYNENPLKTVVELDAHDKEVFWLKIKIEELQDRLFDVHFHLEADSSHFDLDQARKAADPEAYIQEDDDKKLTLDTRVDMLFESFIKELLGEHCGDCVCQPCSCLKCHAESILGVETLSPRPGKHVLMKIGGSFGKGRTLAEALDYLKGHVIDRVKPEGWTSYTQEQYEKFLPSWEDQQRRAYEWLKGYAEEHFTGVA